MQQVNDTPTVLPTVAGTAPPAAQPGGPPVIELRGLSVRLGNRDVLRDLTCTFTGRTIGLLGPNGAGKSTLINTLLGFWPVSAGSAYVFGADIKTHAKSIRSLIGYMPENDAFISKMSAVAFIRLMAELSGLPSEMALERAHEALFYVGLGEARYRKLGTYSLGMKQLAKLAQAIAHGPKLLILDEPTNGLDPPARQRMIRLIREMHESREMHIVLCSHLLRDVEEICEEVVILKQGRVVHYSNLNDERRSNRRFLELELQGDTSNFVPAVESLGCECAPGATEPFEGRAGRQRRDSRHLPRRLRAERPDPAAELPPRHARRHFPEGDGEQQWRSINARIADTPAPLRPPGPASWCSIAFRAATCFGRNFKPRSWCSASSFPCCALLGIYANDHLSAFSFLGQRSGPLFVIDGKYFLIYMIVQGALAFILTSFIGPGLVSPDLANGALTLYLCRPLSQNRVCRWERCRSWSSSCPGSPGYRAWCCSLFRPVCPAGSG